MMKVGVKIMPRLEVLDSQGRAVEKTLETNGRKVGRARVGKYVELDINEASEDKALKKAHEIAEFVLYNPLIETFELEVVKTK
jgi:phosphoribosylformylglycinamidine synthase subunit PurS